MKRVLAAFLVVTVAGLSHGDLKSELAASDAKLDRAMRAKDLKSIEAILRASTTPDFKYEEDGKTQDFKTFIGNLNASVAMMDKVTSSSSKNRSLMVHGSTATGIAEHTMAGTMTGPDKKTHTTTWTGVFEEHYRKVAGKWKTSSILAKGQKYFMDGKPAKM